MKAEKGRCEYRFGPFLFDPRSEQLTGDGKRIRLSPQARRILLKFLESRGQAIGADELKEAGWPHKRIDTVSDDSLRGAVYELRQALGDKGKNQDIIATDNAQGRRFLLDVEYVAVGRTPDEVEEVAQQPEVPSQNPVPSTPVLPDEIPEEVSPPNPQPPRPAVWRVPRLLVIVAVLLTLYGAVRLWQAARSRWEEEDFARRQQAKNSYREGWRIYDEGDVHRKNGQEETARSKYHEAEAHLRRATQLSPEEALYHSALGWALFDEGENKEAREEFNEALKLHPTQAVKADAQHGLGLVYESANDLEKAEDHLNEAVSLSSGEELKSCEEDLERVRRMKPE